MGRGTLEVWSRYAHGAVEVHSWCSRTLVVRSRYTRGAVEVRSWWVEVHFLFSAALTFR